VSVNYIAKTREKGRRCGLSRGEKVVMSTIEIVVVAYEGTKNEALHFGTDIHDFYD
jgi:hypothetical protein